MKKIKLFVCDWDGTIVDSVAKITQCKQWLAKKYGLKPPSEALVKSVLGKEFKLALATSFSDADQTMLTKLAIEFHALMQQPQYQAEPFDKALSVLSDLKNHHAIKLAVATSKARSELTVALSYLKIENLFDVICCADDHRSKPDPEMLKFIMRKVQLTSTETIMIGDTIVDAEFAENAGVPFIGVTFGAHSLEKLQQYKAKGFIASWDELPGLLQLG